MSAHSSLKDRALKRREGLKKRSHTGQRRASSRKRANQRARWKADRTAADSLGLRVHELRLRRADEARQIRLNPPKLVTVREPEYGYGYGSRYSYSRY